MIEAYAIGVNISLRGNVGGELAKVAQQFEALNRVISQTKSAINELGSGMGALNRLSRSAAEGWQNAASQMRAAARAAREAAEAMARVQNAPSAGNGGGPAQPAPSTMLRVQPPLLMLPPPSTGFTMWNDPRLPTGGGSRLLFGPPIPPPGSSGGPGSGALGPYGPTGPFAGGPGTGSPNTALTVPPGGGGGGPGIPLNLGSLPGQPQMPHINQADAFVGAQGFGALGHFLWGIVSGAGHAAADVEHQRRTLRVGGTSDDTIEEATRAAWETFRTVHGSRVADNIQMFGELRSQVSSDKQALDIMPDIARIGLLLQNLTGQKPDKLGQTVMRVLEQRGQIFGPDGHTMDLGKVRNELGMMFQAMANSHGLLTPATFLQFMQQAGPAGMAMTPDAFYRLMPTAAQTMGGHRAGTAMSSLFSQFVGGVMTQRVAQELIDLKLMDPTKVHVRRGGQVTVDAGAIAGFDMHNPFAFFAGEDSRFQRAVREHRPGKTSAEVLEGTFDPAIVQELYRGVGRETTRRLIAEIIQLAPTFERDHRLRMGTMTPENAERELQGDPNMRMTQLNAALNGLMIALGGPILDQAIKGVTALTDAINAFGQFAKDHPDATKYMMEYGFKLAVLSMGIGIFGNALALFPSMFRLVGLGFGISSFGLSLAAMGTGEVAAAMRQAPGLLGAMGIAIAAFVSRLSLVGIGVAALQAGKNLLTDNKDMHEFFLRNIPGAQWLNRAVNGLTGGNVGSSDADQRRMYPHLFKDDPPAKPAPPARSRDSAPEYQPMNYVPQSREPQKFEIHVQGTVDGRTLLSFVSQGIARAGAGPSGGSTGFDARTIYHGGMSAA